MLDFEFFSPTKFIFGRGSELKVGSMAIQYGKKALIHYGRGSAQGSGLLDRISKSLNDANIEVLKLGGVQPNPRDTLVYEGIEICKKNQVDLIIAVGGGSVIDSAKAISIGALYDGDFWDFYSGKKPERRLPLGVILTIPASGSEGSFGSVITQESTKLKRDCVDDLLRPDFTLMNPELTFTLSQYQTACGVADIMSHVLERYMDNIVGVDLIDNLSEAILNSVMQNARILAREPENYNARANIMWAGMIAHNDSVGVGRKGDWSSHQLEHELSGMYDVPHGAGLAVVLPAFMRYQYKYNVMRFARLAANVFGIGVNYDNLEHTALAGIEALEDFFSKIGLPVTFAELGAKEEDIPELVEKCVFNNDGKLGFLNPLTRAEAQEILKLACR